MRAYPPLWCRIGELDPVSAVPDLHGDGWSVRCHLEPTLPLLGTQVRIELTGHDRAPRRGLAFVVSITSDGDPAGTGWPCQAVLLAASPLTESADRTGRPTMTSLDHRQIDLTDPDRELTESETSDVIHRADYPRGAIAREITREVTGIVTGWACDLADARCGVPVDLPPGPHPGRGTLRWYRHYIAHLDDCADKLAPGWRDEAHARGPYPWCDVAFGPVNRHGRTAPAPDRGNTPGYDRDSRQPSVVGHWTFEMPPRQV